MIAKDHQRGLGGSWALGRVVEAGPDRGGPRPSRWWAFRLVAWVVAVRAGGVAGLLRLAALGKEGRGHLTYYPTQLQFEH